MATLGEKARRQIFDQPQTHTNVGGATVTIDYLTITSKVQPRLSDHVATNSSDNASYLTGTVQQLSMVTIRGNQLTLS